MILPVIYDNLNILLETGSVYVVAYFQELANQFTNPITAFAQIMGFIPMFLGFFVFYFNDRKKILIIKVICDSMFVAHFCLLNQWTGAAVCIVNVGRGLLFAQRDRKPVFDMLWVPVLICSLTIGGSLLTWAGPMSLLPMFGSVIAAIGYWCNSTAHLRKFNFVGIALWLVYSTITMSVPSMLNNVINLISIIRTEIALCLHKRKEAHNG